VPEAQLGHHEDVFDTSARGKGAFVYDVVVRIAMNDRTFDVRRRDVRGIYVDDVNATSICTAFSSGVAATLHRDRRSCRCEKYYGNQRLYHDLIVALVRDVAGKNLLSGSSQSQGTCRV
jgi:hypothetical protein